MNALVVVANRLPIEIGADGSLTPSPGGLASALSSVIHHGTQWVGWGGPLAPRRGPFDYDDLRIHPVALSTDDIVKYYEGFSNSILWPLFHGRLRHVELNRSWWRSYRTVNERFAAAAARIAPLGGTVWVHDYHLLLAPALIRARRPDLHIGLFLHIPFPNAQLFSMLPWRSELIEGMLAADVVGFQVPDDAANFVAAAERLAGTQTVGKTVVAGSHSVHVDAYPISVDFEFWDALGRGAAAKAAQQRHQLDVATIFLGIDRLDYTKGISERLQAFGELLDEGQLQADECAFVQVAVPSRTDVAAYQEERKAVEALIDRINAKHRRTNGTLPLVYVDTSLDDVGLATWYRAADALVVTSLADGMNLVAKEFVSARDDLGATLILSEFAGAAADLDGAIIVNPYDIEAIKRALMSAAAMPLSARASRLKTMRSAVRVHDVGHWVRTFLEQLESARQVRAGDPSRRTSGAGGRDVRLAWSAIRTLRP
jgi:trehalose 6-phosphate synthase